MKILIIASARSGGYYFTKQLSNTYNLEFFHEPQTYDEFHDISNRDGVCVKIVPNHTVRYIPDTDRKNRISILCKDITSKNFDKIILLDRRNKKEHTESLVNLAKVSKDMYQNWTRDDKLFDKVDTQDWEYFNHLSNISTSFLNALSEKLNTSVIYYEDLYYDTDSVDLQGLEFKPDISKKLRKNVQQGKSIL